MGGRAARARAKDPGGSRHVVRGTGQGQAMIPPLGLHLQVRCFYSCFAVMEGTRSSQNAGRIRQGLRPLVPSAGRESGEEGAQKEGSRTEREDFAEGEAQAGKRSAHLGQVRSQRLLATRKSTAVCWASEMEKPLLPVLSLAEEKIRPGKQEVWKA